MSHRIKKWGNSLGLRIPQKFAETYGWKENSQLELLESDNGIIICNLLSH